VTGDNGETFTSVTSPTDVEREGNENVLGLPVEANFVDDAGQNYTLDGPSIAPVLDESATLSLSPITGSPVEGATLTVAGLVTSDENSAALVYSSQRFYSSGWWDTPIELSSDISGGTFTYLTSPTLVVLQADAIAVWATGVTEAPGLTLATSGRGSAEGSIAPSGIGVTGGGLDSIQFSSLAAPTTASPLPPPATGPLTLSSVVLDDFSWAQGWGSPDNPRIIADVNGDGTSDYIGFGDQSTFIAYGGTFSIGGSTGAGFTSAIAAVKDFGTSEGYTANVQRGAAAAGVGDGDILYGQGFAGVYWYKATGETAKTDAAGNTYNVLQYQSTPNFYGNFGSQEGWTSANGFQILKAGSSDTYASILGFGNDGIVVGPQAFAPGANAASSYVISFAAGNNSGWDQKVDIRTFTDVNGKMIDLNGDGIADFVGMGPKGLVYAYGNTSGPGGAYKLGTLQTAHISGGNADLGEAQGWTDAATVRDIVADPKTGFDDIIAFGAAGVYVAMGQNPTTHNGEPFGQLYLAMADFGSNQGWSVGQTPRLVGDVTGDGIPDIVGFGTNSTFVAVGSRDSSGNLQFKVDPNKTIGDFGAAEGWSGKDLQTLRTLGNVTGAGSTSSQSDLILSGPFNTQVWHFT